MLQDSIRYRDRYICLQELSVECLEDYEACAMWSQPYMNNANTILIFTQGSWNARIEGSDCAFLPGELCLIKPLESILLSPLKYPCAFYRLSFSTHYFHVIDPEERLCRAICDRELGVGNRVTSAQYDYRRLQGYLAEIRDGDDAASRHLSLAICLAELLHDLMIHRTRDAVDTRPEEVRQIIVYLNAHCFEPIDVALLARQMFISRTKLARLVKESTGYPIWDYVLNKRILRSVQLLHMGYSNQQAAAMVGFKNYSTYYKAFLRIVGLRPNAEHPSPEDDPLLFKFYDARAARDWVEIKSQSREHPDAG